MKKSIIISLVVVVLLVGGVAVIWLYTSPPQHLGKQLARVTTISRTTLSFGGTTYSITTGEYSGCIPPVQCHPTTITTWISITSTIELQGFELCSANCNYPSPHLSGIIIFNATAPLKSLQLLANGTDEGVQKWNGTDLTRFALDYKGGFNNPPVVKGDAYVIEFVAVFEDNSAATAETTIVAT